MHDVSLIIVLICCRGILEEMESGDGEPLSLSISLVKIFSPEIKKLGLN